MSQSVIREKRGEYRVALAQALQRITAALARRPDVERAILFGSYRDGRRDLFTDEDLRWTRHLADEGAYHLACFLAQQVADKAIKAFLYAQGEEIVLGHSVERLCGTAADYDSEFAVRARSWTVLDE